MPDNSARRPGDFLVAYFILTFALTWGTAAFAIFFPALFTALFGFMISAIWAVYSTEAIWAAFVTTAAMFGIMSLLGYATRIDLSKFASILFMALIGVIIASVVMAGSVTPREKMSCFITFMPRETRMAARGLGQEDHGSGRAGGSVPQGR